jgi:hypothetical protein
LRGWGPGDVNPIVPLEARTKQCLSGRGQGAWVKGAGISVEYGSGVAQEAGVPVGYGSGMVQDTRVPAGRGSGTGLGPGTV